MENKVAMNEKLFTQLNAMSKEALENLIEDAKDYAMYKGIAKRDLNLSKDARIHLPFCLIPCEFPRIWYGIAYRLQEWLNLVLLKVSYSRGFLKECLSSTIESDDFIRKLFDIYEEVFDTQPCTQVTLGLIRCDYLIDCDGYGSVVGIKQVENNTFAAGLGAVSPLLKDLYQFIFKKLKWNDSSLIMPETYSCLGLATGLIIAFKTVGRMNSVILFVVEEATFNILDQRILEYKILELDSEIKVLRYTFKDLRNNVELRDRRLYVKGIEVAVVYYRVGYAPEHYELEDWDTRLLIEKSKAIKCPSIGLHLAGTKKVQSCLANKGVLEKFVDPHIAEQLRRMFAEQYPLDRAENFIIKNAIGSPDRFVLKSEREGGGNNLYGLDMVKFLMEAQYEQIKTSPYILMQRIKSPEVPNYIIQSNKPPVACNVNCELGIFGAILGDDKVLLSNKVVGHLLRCKPVETNEGGIASGAGALSYPYFV